MRRHAGRKAASLLNLAGMALLTASSAVGLVAVSWRVAGPPTIGAGAISIAAAASGFMLLRRLGGRSLPVVFLTAALVSLSAVAIAIMLPRYTWPACGGAFGLILGSFTSSDVTLSATILLRFALRTVGAVLALMLAFGETMVVIPVVLAAGVAACVAWLFERWDRRAVGE